MAVVLHHAPTKKLEALEVLLGLHVGEAIKLQEPENHLLTFFVRSQEGSLNFLVFLNDELFLNFQCFFHLFRLLLGLGRLVYSFNQILPQPRAFSLNRINLGVGHHYLLFTAQVVCR